jgi:lactate dehydrogenase-like 2-hydroxyacid dehydrogenase
MAPKLLQIGSLTERMKDKLAAEFEILHLPMDDTQAAFLKEHAASISAVVNIGHYGVPPELMAALTNLKIISNYGVGYDTIDAAAAAERGIVVTHTPDVLNDEVANTAILLWFAVSRRLVPNDAYVRAGRWEHEGGTSLTRTVQGRTVGIVGLGRIGQAIADRLAVFDATVLYHARSEKEVPYTYFADLTEMARVCDVMIVITPGGPDTRHMVNAEVIDALGPEGILVNVARGTVVDETALVTALQAGRLGGAGLDVFEHEPKVPAALLDMDNVVLQPHVGSATRETRQAMGDLTCQNLTQWRKEGTTVTPVPECKALR